MPEETSLKVGDTVSLKSGGPLMTVNSIEGEDSVICKWFVNNIRKEDRFANAAVKKVDGPQTLDELFSGGWPS
jgi:uncharacterized protein YodC (DUF2158 family)